MWLIIPIGDVFALEPEGFAAASADDAFLDLVGALPRGGQRGANQWTGYVLKIYYGAGGSQQKLITGNDTNTLFIEGTFSAIPVPADYYEIRFPERRASIWTTRKCRTTVLPRS